MRIDEGAAHTPGPWAASQYTTEIEITGRGGETICAVIVDRHADSPQALRRKADARILASALLGLELAEMVQDREALLSRLGRPASRQEWSSIVAKALELLSVAKGEQ